MEKVRIIKTRYDFDEVDNIDNFKFADVTTDDEFPLPIKFGWIENINDEVMVSSVYVCRLIDGEELTDQEKKELEDWIDSTAETYEERRNVYS